METKQLQDWLQDEFSRVEQITINLNQKRIDGTLNGGDAELIKQTRRELIALKSVSAAYLERFEHSNLAHLLEVQTVCLKTLLPDMLAFVNRMNEEMGIEPEDLESFTAYMTSESL